MMTSKTNSPDQPASSQRWTVKDILGLYDLPLLDLLCRAQAVHHTHHEANAVQLSSLQSIKKGGCPEDCSYGPQSARYDTGVEKEALMPLDEVIEAARQAKANGAQRFCMGAAWRSPTARQIDTVAEMVTAVKELGLETCVTLGMLKEGHAEPLKDAGLDYYNHNLDTSPEFYEEIISTRTYEDRLDMLERVRAVGQSGVLSGICALQPFGQAQRHAVI